MMEPMIVLTGKRDGGTQDVLGFFKPGDLGAAMVVAKQFLEESGDCARSIIRIEIYNPKA